MAKNGIEFTAADCPACGGLGVAWKADGCPPCDACDGTGRVAVRLASEAPRRTRRFLVGFTVMLFLAAVALLISEFWWRKP